MTTYWYETKDGKTNRLDQTSTNLVVFYLLHTLEGNLLEVYSEKAIPGKTYPVKVIHYSSRGFVDNQEL